MTLTQAIELLDNASARNFASRQALIDACNLLAEKILESLDFASAPNDSIKLPRGYRGVRTSHYYAQTYLHSLILQAKAGGSVAINHTACRHCGDEWDDAPRAYLLDFAKDCATGLLEEIAAQLAQQAQENEAAIEQVEYATR